MKFKQENDRLLNSFFERTFFSGWTNNDPRYENFRRLELILNSKCNLRCKYCYYTKHGRELYPDKISKPKLILDNLKMLLDWLIEHGYAPTIDFFSGEPLFQNVGFDALYMILSMFRPVKMKPKAIVIPTNYTFLLSKSLTGRVEDLIEDSKGSIPIYLSASFDGKFCEGNRPMKTKVDRRVNAYYNKCFRFNKRHGFGFHPMVYSELIERWRDNFLWFQSMFKRFNIPFNNIYLLEVRNVEWSKPQLREYAKFIKFLIKWTFENPCKGGVSNYLDFIFKRRGYNILSNCLTTIGRGVGCSLQSCLYVRLGDLAIVPCHRQSYDEFILGRFKVEDEKIVGIEAEDPELAIAEITFDHKVLPQCESCMIKHLCQGQCPGSMYEITGDPFSVIPSVCRLEHIKVRAMIEAYKEIGIYSAIKARVNENKRAAFELVEKEMMK